MPENSNYGRDRQPDGYYANYFEVGYNAFEVVMDFGQRYSGTDKASRHIRIITGPAYAKAFFRLLQASVEKYEAAYGAIADDTEDEGDEETTG